MENTPDLQIEHQNVPANHQGLHDFLYGAPDEHAVTTVAPLNLDSDRLIPLADWQVLAENARVAGVYAVVDTAERTQYVGYSRNVLTSLKGHLAEHGSDVCAAVRVQVFKFPKREEMESLRDAWIAQLEVVPSGNTGAGGVWATTVGEIAKAAMSEPERVAYEEKKLKLRRAMADSALSRELDAAAITDEQKREHFAAAMTEDNWSAVIKEQTAETL
ncbi:MULTISPECIES: GIY-YIG nuclease family protein [unclassified Chamaesiphon]|uniref:GIY-YIG nuclease family protein n=1 Tax=unclassified Chamaesiphon TaxID=2620921 RepID=UPI00286C879A|nr:MULTISPECIES: GIY-YIG nuclease family protein [unclassified Chamaesiphon]